MGYGAHTGRTIPPHLNADAERLRTPRRTVDHAAGLLDASCIKFAGRYGCLHGAPRRSIGGRRRGPRPTPTGRRRRCFCGIDWRPALEQAARGLLTGPTLVDGFILDALGSVAADACADALAERVRCELAAWGWKSTNRFSPGYCSWPTADQAALFALLPKAPAGVDLSASALMHPIKSVSGIIGIGPEVTYQPYPCSFCGMTACHQRLVESRI